MTYRGQSYDVLDSTYVPKGRMDQHRRYLNHEYAFPSKPRNMWEIGVGGGLHNISGDIPALMPWNGGGFGLHAHVRKAWGYVFSSRLQYNYAIDKGQQWQGETNYKYNTAWTQNGYVPQNAIPTNQGGTGTQGGGPVPAPEVIFHNYRTESHQLNLDFMASLHNIRFHRVQTGISPYLFLGLGALAYEARVNTLDANFQKYNTVFNAVDPNAQIHENRIDIQEYLRDNMDETYETPAETERDRRRPGVLNNKTLAFTPSLGVGFQFRVTKHFNISIEDRVSMPWDEDLLDGQRWASQVPGSPVFSQNNDGINYLSLGLNFNLGNSKTHVEPLYWMNPLDHAYNELSSPRHMILPDPILPDADGDGITDQFDKCPGTPAGVAVDAHGCEMDTDQDGVPDSRDKQIITPTECQPVDADGVGKCPCPEGCGTMAASCGSIGSGAISFSSNSSRIAPGAQAQLASLAAAMQANPTCKVVVTGAGSGSKVQQQRSWDRVNAVIEYMSEKHGIDRNRFIFQYGQAGDADGVMYRSAMAGEEGPGNVPPPFPNLRRD